MQKAPFESVLQAVTQYQEADGWAVMGNERIATAMITVQMLKYQDYLGFFFFFFASLNIIGIFLQGQFPEPM